MRRTGALLTFIVLATAASCGERPESRNMSSNDVAGALAEVRIEPGLWEVRSAVIDVSAPNLPVDVRRRMVGPRRGLRNCVTPAQAARPGANFLAGRRSRDCSYRDFAMANGRLQGTMTCPDVAVTMDGRYGPQAFDLRMMMTSRMPDGATMRVDVATRGRRIGRCEEGESE